MNKAELEARIAELTAQKEAMNMIVEAADKVSKDYMTFVDARSRRGCDWSHDERKTFERSAWKLAQLFRK